MTFELVLHLIIDFHRCPNFHVDYGLLVFVGPTCTSLT